MTNAPLEDQVHDSLHRTLDPLQRTPLTVGDVRGRARRIQRRRRLAAAAAATAVLAIAVPAGLRITSPAQRAEVPPVAPTPGVTGPVRIDPRSAEVGDEPGVPLIDTTGPTLVADGAAVDLATPYEAITPYLDGWVAIRNDEGARSLELLDQDLTVTDGPIDSGGLVVSPDGARIAWTEWDGSRWQVVSADSAGDEEWAYTPFPPGPRDAQVEPVGFASDSAVVVSRVDPADGTLTTFVADGDVTELSGLSGAVSASPVAGLVAGRTSDQGAGSCSAVVDGPAGAGGPVWQTCDRRLGAFSPDGRHLVGLADTPDGASPGLSVLDAATGEPVIDFEVTAARDRVVGIAEAVWEDDETLLATYEDGNQQWVVRLGLDGTVQRAYGPVTDDDYGRSLRLTPGTRG